MPVANFKINLSSIFSDKEDITVFQDVEMTSETEEIMLCVLKELFKYIRPNLLNVDINLHLLLNGIEDPAWYIKNKLGKTSSHHIHLTNREKEIVAFIAQGYTNKEIAKELYIGLETVRSHRKNILFKTGSKNGAMLIKVIDKNFI